MFMLDAAGGLSLARRKAAPPMEPHHVDDLENRLKRRGIFASSRGWRHHEMSLPSALNRSLEFDFLQRDLSQSIKLVHGCDDLLVALAV